MADVSQAASNLKHISNTVSSSLRTHKERVAKQLVDRLFDGTPPTDLTMERLIGAMADYLDASTQGFAESASLVLTEVAEDRVASTSESVALEKLRDEVISQRTYIDGAYGTGTAAEFGYAGGTPETTTKVVEAARSIEDKLRSKSFPTARPGRAPIDKALLADQLRDLRQDVEDAAKGNLEEKRETQAARSDRNNTRSDWDLDYKGVANTAVGLFLIAREQELAERVRPTAGRRQGQPEDQDLDVEPQPLVDA